MVSTTCLVATAIIAAALGIEKSSAFSPPAQHVRNSRCTNINQDVVQLLENKDNGINLDSIVSSLPSPDSVKENILEGEFGERGEQYVIAQFSLLLFIAIGTVPIIGDPLITLTGPALILAGLYVVYSSVADLGNNLSPWPVPAQSGKASLINDGIYSYVRHPMYAGVLLGMVGLSLITDSVSRFLLTLALYFVLDAKSDFEESKLIDSYGSDYEDYQMKVPGKFIPPIMK